MHVGTKQFKRWVCAQGLMLSQSLACSVVARALESEAELAAWAPRAAHPAAGRTAREGAASIPGGRCEQRVSQGGRAMMSPHSGMTPGVDAPTAPPLSSVSAWNKPSKAGFVNGSDSENRPTAKGGRTSAPRSYLFLPIWPTVPFGCRAL